MAQGDEVRISAWRSSDNEIFWHWAEAEIDRAPEEVVPLINRERKRIVVSFEVAREIAAWARDTIGWDPATRKPLRFSDSDNNTIEPPT